MAQPQMIVEAPRVPEWETPTSRDVILFDEDYDALITLQHVPGELKAKPNWVRWKLETVNGRLTKVPYQLNGHKASSTDLNTWNTYENVVSGVVVGEEQGIGIMTDGSFVGFDLDGCRNPATGEIKEWAQRVINTLGTYTEITPSGYGVRVYASGQLPDGARRFSLDLGAGFGDKVGIECYSDRRYFTVTGNRVGGNSGLQSSNVAQAHQLCSQISREFPSEKRKFAASSNYNSGSVQIERAPDASGMVATSKLALLMYGQIVSRSPFVVQDEHGNKITYPSHSEADMALATLLAMKHNGDADLIDSDFRESSLYRQKWDRLADQTIAKARESAKRLAEKQPKSDVKPQDQSGRVLNFVRGDSIKPKRLKWLWNNRILADKLNVFSGEPDVGKGMTTVDFAARITRHWDFPDCKNELDGPRDVLFLSSEDDMEDTIVPRLRVAGADMTRIHFAEIGENSSGTLTEGIVCLDRDLPVLEEMIKRHPDIVLIIPDPVIAFLGDADPNKDRDVRPIYSKMKSLAKRLNVAWLFVNHWNKNQNASSINRTSGAKTMVSAPRATWMFSKSPEDPTRYLMMKGKGNLSSVNGSKTLAYRIVGERYDFGDGRPPGEVPKLIWDGETEHATEEVLQDQADPRNRRNSKAEELLTKVLTSGAVLARDVYLAGDTEGLSPDKLKRARYTLGYIAAQIDNRWYWAKSEEDIASRKAQFYTPGTRPNIGGVTADVDFGRSVHR
jgi:AAA domain